MGNYALAEEIFEYLCVSIIGILYVIISIEMVRLLIKTKSMGSVKGILIKLRLNSIISLIILGGSNIIVGMLSTFSIGLPLTQVLNTITLSILLIGIMLMIVILLIRTLIWFRNIDRSDDIIRSSSSYKLLKKKNIFF